MIQPVHTQRPRPNRRWRTVSQRPRSTVVLRRDRRLGGQQRQRCKWLEERRGDPCIRQRSARTACVLPPCRRRSHTDHPPNPSSAWQSYSSRKWIGTSRPILQPNPMLPWRQVRRPWGDSEGSQFGKSSAMLRQLVHLSRRAAVRTIARHRRTSCPASASGLWRAPRSSRTAIWETALTTFGKPAPTERIDQSSPVQTRTDNRRSPRA